MRPIPRSLLIHSGELLTPSGEDIYGKPSFSSTNLANIRIEPTSKIIQTKDNKSVQLSSILFFDCMNSIPKDTVFFEEQTLVFMGRKYTVTSIEMLFDGRKLHHYEVGLI